ncbi:MAG: tetratricopeptide repeat protein [Deltaproteobacteria bacterium]|jgi:tetratricopeptide (TPR) repeat protein|nr:tetratricopeptide repeat protein [Deltaproteobacteria bacterium]MBW2237914.1 tetratricopeptide repeat protein [Deltaproteobacteria bacterium]MBW2572503.1 tetratricopeptide repeat protein [Deltaproteobacteria bacterium]MBW2670709.1 tetratricopeptide repeat protein [Deltaproteobacteria bacterium]
MIIELKRRHFDEFVKGQLQTVGCYKVKKMQNFRFVWIFLAVMAICTVACTSNLQVRKKQGEAARNLGEVYFMQGNYTEALREFLKAESLYPDDPFLQNDLGLTYKAKKKPDLAITHFKKALALKPDYAPAKNNLGTVYLDKGEWDAAIEYFKEVGESLVYASPHLPLSNLGWAYYNKKAYEQAEKYYLEALEMAPKFINALRGLGLTYMAMGRIPEGVEILEGAIKEYPRTALLYFDLATAYTLLHDYESALNAYKKVDELAPKSALARQAEKAVQKIKHLE